MRVHERSQKLRPCRKRGDMVLYFRSCGRNPWGINVEKQSFHETFATSADDTGQASATALPPFVFQQGNSNGLMEDTEGGSSFSDCQVGSKAWLIQ